MSTDLAPKHLRLSYACDGQDMLTSAEDAVKGDEHACPKCSDQVTLRRGDVRVAHFAHQPGTNCSPESATHKIAKLLVTQAINLNALGSDQAITIKTGCEHCGCSVTRTIPPGTFTGAKEEVAVGNYWVDVAGYNGAKIALSVEIRHTHAVGEEKAGSLDGFWVELNAADVIANPFNWTPLASKLKAILCEPCKKQVKATQNVLAQWSLPSDNCSSIFNPERAKYIASREECWKCKKIIPVFWWHGVPFAEDSPPEPRPATVQYRYSKNYGGKYWANTCPGCKSIQGDNFLFLFDGASLASDHLPLRRISGQRGTVNITTGPGAVNSFLDTVLGKYR